ncbi:uncharacterized protein LOC112574832 [Pomacea canaliculata]|uniref:uncharacterized protein LOC112574832 n=1 Tax=Pomacea canaliculata TaxID=400727 RepID=UPI000D73400A|nr:uncharacterized protein LOC112574832 [Pomacea canaliculata]
MSTRWYLRQVLSVCVTFIFRLHLLFTTRALAQDATCEVPSVEPLASTSVTCHFPEDVSKTNKGFSIVMYKGNRSQDEKDILECWWLEGKMGCAVSSGYKYNRMVSNQLTLDIPQVSAQHIGSYGCKLVNMDRNHIKPCEMKIKFVGKTMCDVSSVEHGSQTSLTCYFPEDVSKTKKDLAVYHYASDGHRDRVLHVGWLGDRVNCISDRRYQFDCSFTNHLTLTIPRASTDEEGMYSCDIGSLGADRSENCLFYLKKDAVNSSCSIPSVQEEQPTTLTCTFSVDINVTRRDFTVVRLGDKTNNSVAILVCT